MLAQGIISQQKIKDYYHVTKPNVISLLVFTGAATYVATAAWATNIVTLLAVSVSVWLGSAAANTVGSYFDRDIDAVMGRTRSRPIPTGRIPPRHAVAYGIVLLILSIALSLVLLSWISAVAMFAGFVDYALVYSLLLKRRTALNIVLGGFSGIMPVMVGYFATAHPVISIATAVFAGFLVFFWIPEHIWALAVRFKKDYQAAKVPMLPVVVSEKTAVQLIAFTSIIMVIFSLAPLAYPNLGLHYVYLGTAAILGTVVLALNFWLLRKPAAQRAWTVFKFSSPYLFFIFMGIMADILIYSH